MKSEEQCRFCARFLSIVDVLDDVIFLICRGCEKSYTLYQKELKQLI